MNYTETQFIILCAFVFLAAMALRSHPELRKWMLILVSLFVISTWGLSGLLIFIVFAVCNFLAAAWMSRSSKSISRIVLIIAIAIDVAALATFKYSDFINANLTAVIGWSLPKFPLDVPLAISFYTFHIISYLVDLHAGRTARTTFGNYLFYLGFFPHIVAGPIVRTWQFTAQIQTTRHFRQDMVLGFQFMVVGYFLKCVVADNIAGVIDPLWANAAALYPADYWMIAIFYYFQIYGDFAGYSLMALGMARLLGFRLPANFRVPLTAVSLREFWRRWHITLSRWLRDYVYFPLGGSRGNKIQTVLSIVLTMLIGGLWHGAAWGFVLWGAMHGIGLVLERSLYVDRLKNSGFWTSICWLITQAWVVLAWVPFRSSDIDTALIMLRGMTSMIFMFDFRPKSSYAVLAPFALAVIAHQCAPLVMRVAGRRHFGVLLGVSTAILLLLSITISAPNKTFIYFKF